MFDRITGGQIQDSMASLLGPAHKLAAEYSKRYGVSVEDLLNRRDSRRIAHIRQDCMAEIRRELRYSYPRIGEIFNLDHTTVIAGVRSSDKRRKEKSVWDRVL